MITSTPPSFADVAEGVRATIAAYALALDDGRTEDLVATFCADGSCEIPGLGTHVGHDALRTAFARVTPRQPQRHIVSNTLVTGWTDQEASSISDLMFLLEGETGWAIALVGRYHDTFRYEDGVWRFASRTATFVS